MQHISDLSLSHVLSTSLLLPLLSTPISSHTHTLVSLDTLKMKLVTAVGAWMTPVDVIVSAGPDTTAEVALALMQEKVGGLVGH